MPLGDVRIDEALWAQASPERRREWGQVVADLLHDHRVDHAGDPLRLLVRLDGGDTVIEASDGAGAAVTTVKLPMSVLQPHFKEYVAICRDMGKLRESAHSPRVEALDIAKRLSHDEAADALLRLCKPLGPDHRTCRRLFTLLVSLHFDTTQLFLKHHRGRGRR
jgi:uncharacterized protein (UPF0262 family)